MKVNWDKEQETSEIEWERGDQVAYIPLHVRQNTDRKEWIKHNDVELGFIWLDEGDTALCRYFSRHSDSLRTRANSERANKEDLFLHIHTAESVIKYWVDVIERERDHSLPKIP